MLADVADYRNQFENLDNLPSEARMSLNRVDASLQRSTAIALESERLGQETMEDLAIQRERLEGARDRLEEANTELSKIEDFFQVLRLFSVNFAFDTRNLDGSNGEQAFPHRNHHRRAFNHRNDCLHQMVQKLMPLYLFSLLLCPNHVLYLPKESSLFYFCAH